MRGMPGLLKSAFKQGVPAWRVVDSNWGTIPQHLPEQSRRLEAEGIRICAASGKVLDVDAVSWTPTHDELYMVEQRRDQKRPRDDE